MRLFYFFIFAICLTFFSCNYIQNKSANNIVLRIQPFSGMNGNEVRVLADSIRKLYPDVIISQPLQLPEFAFYIPRKRYKADSLLKFLSSIAKPNEILIGITTKDISNNKGSTVDWGVIGLGNCPGNSCVVSTFRLNKSKEKDQLFKVALHELGHTFSLPHCTDPKCFMRDAKGGNPTDEEKYFCPKCKRYLQNHNWKL